VCDSAAAAPVVTRPVPLREVILSLRNVAIPSGDLYPNGLTIIPPNGEIQSTVRPPGWLFRKSAGYASIRPGKSSFQDGEHGLGIHFVPQRYAEDVGSYTDMHGYPLLVDKEKAAHLTDLADLPGSDRLDDDGTITPYEAGANKGVMLSDGKQAPVGGRDIRESEKTIKDMGDRTIGRPYSRATAFGDSVLHNPVGMFRQEWHDSPVKAVAVASGVVGIIYLVASNLEREFRSRGGGVGAVGSAPVAAAGATVASATHTANQAATAAGEAAKAAASAAGDAAEAAGKAAEGVTDAVADAVKSD
jgi:hypothetical protein